MDQPWDSACGQEQQAAYPTLHSISKKLFGRGVEGSFVPAAKQNKRFLGSRHKRLPPRNAYFRNPLQVSEVTIELLGLCGSYLTLAGSPRRQECKSTNWRRCVTSCEHSYCTPATS